MSANFNIGGNNFDGTSSQVYQNTYDPDRAYTQNLLAYEMYGPEAVTGTQYGYYDPFQAANPMYSEMPTWNWSTNPNGPPANTGPQGASGYGTGDGQQTTQPATGGAGSPPPTTSDGRTVSMRGKIGTSPAANNGGFAGGSAPDDPGAGPGGSHPGYNGGNQGGTPAGPRNPGNANQIINFGNSQTGRSMPPTILGAPPAGAGPMTRPGYGTTAPTYQTNGSGGWGTGGASGNANLASGALWDSFSDEMNHPDLSDAQKQAINAASTEGINAKYGSAQGQIARNTSATNNRIGANAAITELGMDQANSVGAAQRQNAIDFENIRQQRLAAGQQGVAGLYSGEQGFLGNLMGARASLDSQPVGRNGFSGSSGTGSNTSLGIGI